ncbi:MAG: cytochrome C biogenesis protein [Candidatus Saccharibacteria bacterium]|nr:MAG: cytochrome C biogenesis protein [Candidatus Saccharibacteria bacterium]
MIELFIVSFIAGVLTVLAPCILPLIPVILGGSALHDSSESKQSLKKPVVMIASLIISIVTFTLLLKFTTSLLGVPAQVWSGIAGAIILLFGISTLFPIVWEKAMVATGMQAAASRLMSRSQSGHGVVKDILLGAALGPVFNSCSPTYALIVAVVLPVSFGEGLAYLMAYSIGLGAILLLLAIFGRALVVRFKWLSAPGGIFQRSIGVLFIVVGLAVIFGIDKQIQAFVLESGWYDPVVKIEEALR